MGKSTESKQRLRIIFTKGEEVKYISHLDLMRLWERALRRANIPLLYSKGYNPRPRISIAAPLAVGFTGRREVMDLILERITSPLDFGTSVKKQLPPGITLVEVEEVYPALPSLQSQVRSADYRIIVEACLPEDDVQEKLLALLQREKIPRQRRGKEYDLRPLVQELWLEEQTEREYVLGMRLRTGEGGTGRPDEVLAELHLSESVRAVQRTRLHFSTLAPEG